jgi:acetate kinase
VNVLVLNSGSSSLKFQVIATDLERMRSDGDERLCRGEMEGIGGEATIAVQRPGGTREKLKVPLADIPAAIEWLARWMVSGAAGINELRSLSDIHAVGHRVVHGGEFFSESAVITDEVLKNIEGCIELAPLHNPDNLKGIRAVRKIFASQGGAEPPQVAVFDTAFHHTLPEHAYLYAIPYSLYEQHHVRRYGFHGTSHRYVAHRYRQLRRLNREQTNIITMHLGNGCSAAAIRGGASVDTSMGMTPLEGLVMGTRSGDLDPAAVSFIAEKEKLGGDGVQLLLNRKSGLLGVSGITNDMRGLLEETKKGNRRAQAAVELFCYRARKYIGAFLAAMGSADAVVFTGGIGENSPEVRGRICEGMAWAGLRLDESRNREMTGREGLISSDDSRLLAYAIPTDEELLIARDTVRCILGERHPS